jgi:Stress responsive A/B Barrel Domain
MIRHVVVFSWLPEATDEQKQRAAAEIATLPPLMQGLVSYSFGPDAGLAAGNADFTIIADFDDADAYLAYRDHPAHVDVIKRAIQPIVRQRMGVQLEI